MQTGRQIPSLSLLWTQSLFPVLSVALKVQLPALFGGREGWESQGSFSPYLTSWLAEQSFPLLGAPLWSEKQFKGFCLQVPLDTPGVAAPGWRSASTPSGGGGGVGKVFGSLLHHVRCHPWSSFSIYHPFLCFLWVFPQLRWFDLF